MLNFGAVAGETARQISASSGETFPEWCAAPTRPGTEIQRLHHSGQLHPPLPGKKPDSRIIALPAFPGEVRNSFSGKRR